MKGFIENIECNLVLTKQVQRMSDLFQIVRILWIKSDRLF